MYDIKSYTGTTKDLDLKQGIITAYWSTFDVIDSDNDSIDSKAFNKTISERGPAGSNRIMKLWQHNPTQPLGKPSELYTDAKGLVAVTKITDTTYGMDALKLYADGVLNEHSIGFQTIKSNYDESMKANRLTELKLWEGSVVTWGSNEYTPVIAGKSADKTQLMSHYQNICKAFYSGTYTDDTFKLLEMQKQYFESIFTKSLDVKEPTIVVTPERNQAELLKDLFTNIKLELHFRNINNGRLNQNSC